MSTRNPRLRTALRNAAILLAAYLAMVVSVNVILPAREKTLDEAWGRTLVSLEEFQRQYPRVDDNASALAVERLSAALGVCLVPQAAGRDCARARPAAAALEAYAGVAASHPGPEEYLRTQFARDTGVIDAPPEPLARYLDGRSAELAALREQLLHREPPRWGFDKSRGAELAPPNLQGQLSLHRLLLAGALLALRRGRADDAQAGLRASWLLGFETGRQPLLGCRLATLTALRMQMAVARRLPVAPEGLERRLDGNDPRRALAIALETEAWDLQRRAAGGTPLRGAGPDSPGASWSFSPGRVRLRFSADESSEAMRQRLEAFIPLDPCEAAAGRGPGISPSAGISWWNAFGRSALPDFRGAWARAARVMLEAELTSKLLRLRRLRGAGPAWPGAVAGIAQSACRGERWVYAVSGDGTMSLTFSRPPDGESPQELNIPLSARLGTAEAGAAAGSRER